jgi:prepilin signal peptidase PulO-like enzyme (type II secretory pathway)
MFVLGMHFLLAFSFYTQVENEILVWNFHGGPKKFLLHKISAAFRQITLLNFPVVLILCISWPENWWIILVLYLFGLLLLSTIVLAKYSAFPRVMNVPEGIVIAIGVSFPPLLILAIPYFYKKAQRQLQTILYDSDLRA